MLATVVLENFPRRHAYHAGFDSLGLEVFKRLYTERDFAAGAKQQHFGFTIISIRENICAALHARRRGVFRAVENRYRLPR